MGPRLSLILRGPNLPDVEDIEVDLSDSNWTIFRAIQTIIQVKLTLVWIDADGMNDRPYVSHTSFI